jgi:hypothetical protein
LSAKHLDLIHNGLLHRRSTDVGSANFIRHVSHELACRRFASALGELWGGRLDANMCPNNFEVSVGWPRTAENALGQPITVKEPVNFARGSLAQDTRKRGHAAIVGQPGRLGGQLISLSSARAA